MRRTFFSTLILFTISSCTTVAKNERTLNTNKENLHISREKWEARSDKILIVKPLNGLGNRLRALGSAMVLAEETGRQLWVHWPVGSFHFAGTFWQIFTNKLNLTNGTLLREANPLEITENLKNYDFKSLSDAAIYVSTDSHFREITMNDDEFKDKYAKALATLTPVASVQEKLDTFMKNNNIEAKNTVGIHYRAWSARVGDSGITAAPIATFFETIEKEVPASMRLLLTSDEPEIVEQFKVRYKDRLIHSGFLDPNRGSVKGQLDAVFEWYLLTKTAYIIGTLGSSFSDEAAYLTLEKRKIAVGPSP